MSNLYDCNICHHKHDKHGCRHFIEFPVDNLHTLKYKDTADNIIDKDVKPQFNTFKGEKIKRNSTLKNRYTNTFIKNLQENGITTYDVTSNYNCMCNKTFFDDITNMIKIYAIKCLPDACTWILSNICKCDEGDYGATLCDKCGYIEKGFCGKMCNQCNDVCCHICRKCDEDNVEFI